MADDFMIKDDKEAEAILAQIKEAEEEKDRLIALAKDQIANLNNKIRDLEAKYANTTAFLKSRLGAYLDTVKAKETKTQKSYKLLSGTLVLKKPSFKITYDNEKLIEYLKANDGSGFIKTQESVDWAGLKSGLMISGDDVINAETGEIIEGCSIEEVPASFDIKF